MPNLIPDIRNTVCVCELYILTLVYIYHEAALVDCELNDSWLALDREFYLIGVGKISVRYCI